LGGEGERGFNATSKTVQELNYPGSKHKKTQEPGELGGPARMQKAEGAPGRRGIRKGTRRPLLNKEP